MDDPDFDLPPGVVRLRPRSGGAAARQTGKRLVYEVDVRDGMHVVTYDAKVLTSHPDRASALANAQLIARNFWSQGIPTSVRVVETNGNVSPYISFG